MPLLRNYSIVYSLGEIHLKKIPELTEITCFIRLCFVWHGSFKVLFHPSTTAAEHPVDPRYRLSVIQNFYRLIFSTYFLKME